MDYGVERIFSEIGFEQVEQAVARYVALAVEENRQPCIEVSVIAQKCDDELIVEPEVAENGVVRGEAHVGSVGLVGGCFAGFVYELPALEACGAHHAVAVTPDFKRVAERIHGLDTHTVEADYLLEGLGIVFCAGVHLRGYVDEFAQRDAAAVVAHGYGRFFERHAYLAPVAHAVFVDCIVDYLLEEHVDAVVVIRAVAEFADIHARTQADVLAPIEGLDVVLDIFHGLFGALIEIEGRFVGDIFGIGVGIFVHFARCFTEIGVLNLPDRICLPQIYKKIRSKGNSEV